MNSQSEGGFLQRLKEKNTPKALQTEQNLEKIITKLEATVERQEAVIQRLEAQEERVGKANERASKSIIRRTIKEELMFVGRLILTALQTLLVLALWVWVGLQG